MTAIYAFGFGRGTRNQSGDWLEVWYPRPQLRPDDELASLLSGWIEHSGKPLDQTAAKPLIDSLSQAGLEQQASLLADLVQGPGNAVICILSEDGPPSDVPSAYLKLHLLSHRLIKPQGTDLTGIFARLPNLAWTSEGAIDLNELEQRMLQARVKGCPLQIHSLDKFPRMIDYVVPHGVRIGDAARVRLGAYLGEGTTVMHEGFVNFNAGCEGPNMIEGRISAGVFVGAGSDLGGGCSTMGTLSGGGNLVISVGKDCLIGANAGIGIALGDRCTVEAGLYITAGTKLRVIDHQGNQLKEVKAALLSGQSDLLFRRNSLTGAVECLARSNAVKLNEALHAHN